VTPSASRRTAARRWGAGPSRPRSRPRLSVGACRCGRCSDRPPQSLWSRRRPGTVPGTARRLRGAGSSRRSLRGRGTAVRRGSGTCRRQRRAQASRVALGARV